jgi:hypothetical protein
MAKKRGSKKSKRARVAADGGLEVSLVQIHAALDALENRLLEVKTHQPRAAVGNLLRSTRAFRRAADCQSSMVRVF